jgi:hypothetical protein
MQERALWFGVASVVLNAVGYWPYITGILSGKVRPQRVTWGIWSILTTIAFINQIANGGGYSTLFFGSTTLLVVTVFALSFNYGVGGGSRLDIASLIAASTLFALWAITKDTHATTVIAVLIDAIGAIPTVIKAYLRPDTEVYLQWVLAAISGLFSIIAVPRPDIILFVYPAYVVLTNSVIVAAKYAGGNLRARQAHPGPE